MKKQKAIKTTAAIALGISAVTATAVPGTASAATYKLNAKKQLVKTSNGKLAKGNIVYKGKLYKNGKLAKAKRYTLVGSGSKLQLFYGPTLKKGYKTAQNKTYLFKDGKLAKGTVQAGGGERFYENGKLAKGYDVVTDKKGEKFLYQNGYLKKGLKTATRNNVTQLYKDGKLAEGTVLFKNVLYTEGDVSKGLVEYKDTFYNNGKLANGEVDGAEYQNGVLIATKEEVSLKKATENTEAAKKALAEAVETKDAAKIEEAAKELVAQATAQAAAAQAVAEKATTTAGVETAQAAIKVATEAGKTAVEAAQAAGKTIDSKALDAAVEAANKAVDANEHKPETPTEPETPTTPPTTPGNGGGNNGGGTTPEETEEQKALKKFVADYAVVKDLTVDAVTLENAEAVQTALTSYEVLTDANKEANKDAKIVLDQLAAKLAELKFVADVKNAKLGDTVELTKDITLTEPLTVPEGVVVNGGGHTITINTTANAGVVSGIGLSTGSTLQNVTVQLDASKKEWADNLVEVLENAQVTLKDVAIENGTQAGLTLLSGSKATLQGNITLTNNAWGGIEVYNNANLTLDDAVKVNYTAAELGKPFAWVDAAVAPEDVEKRVTAKEGVLTNDRFVKDATTTQHFWNITPQATDASLSVKDGALFVAFKLDKDLDLSQGASDVKLSYFEKNGETLTPLKNSLDGDKSLVKDKTWDGYLANAEGNPQNYSTGTAKNENYSDVIPANQLIGSLVKNGYHTGEDMNYVPVEDFSKEVGKTFVVEIAITTAEGSTTTQTVEYTVPTPEA